MPTNLERKIQKITVPTIELDKMEMINTDDKDSPIQSSDRQTKQSGSLYPLCMINRYKLTENELVSFNLDLTGFVPRVRISFVMSDGVFLSKSYPKDGDPLSVFIRSRIDEFNPIRCDFDIDSLNSFSSPEGGGEVASYVLEGTLRIPKIDAEFCKAYRDSTSIDALMSVADDLKLGFATNETDTDDKMTWICPYDTYKKFIGDVTKNSYKDDDSFFATFIDHYYILNFVNVNNQFGEDFQLEKAIEVMNAQKDYFEGHELEKFDSVILLCNHPNLRGQGNWISDYVLLNNCGQIVKENGYRRYLQYYDMFVDGAPKDKYKSYFIEPSSTEGTEDKILLRGRTAEPEIFKDTNKNKYMGIQIQSPVNATHENYLHAAVTNWQNSQEVEKMILKVTLTKCNFNLYRGQRVPILILNFGGNVRQKMTQDPEVSEDANVSYDKFLSGHYYIIGMQINWDDRNANFFQELYLSRREWPIPYQELDNIAQGATPST